MTLTIAGPSRRWIHGASVILWLCGCTWHIGAQQSWSCVKMSFLSHTEWCSRECLPHALVIVSSVSGHLGCCHHLTTVKMRQWTRLHGNSPFLPRFYQFDVSRSGISVSYKNPIFKFPFDFYQLLHSNKQGTEIPISPHPFVCAILLPVSHIPMTWAAK